MQSTACRKRKENMGMMKIENTSKEEKQKTKEDGKEYGHNMSEEDKQKNERIHERIQQNQSNNVFKKEKKTMT